MDVNDDMTLWWIGGEDGDLMVTVQEAASFTSPILAHRARVRSSRLLRAHTAALFARWFVWIARAPRQTRAQRAQTAYAAGALCNMRWRVARVVCPCRARRAAARCARARIAYGSAINLAGGLASSWFYGARKQQYLYPATSRVEQRLLCAPLADVAMLRVAPRGGGR